MDSPWIVRDAVWQRWETRCSDLMARSAERTTVTRMFDDAGQERLRAAEERLVPES